MIFMIFLFYYNNLCNLQSHKKKGNHREKRISILHHIWSCLLHCIMIMQCIGNLVVSPTWLMTSPTNFSSLQQQQISLGEKSKFPHTNHKKPSVSSHTLAPTTICDLSHSVCWSPLTDLGHIGSVTYVCHPLWFVYGHRKGILMSPLSEFVCLSLLVLMEPGP